MQSNNEILDDEARFNALINEFGDRARRLLVSRGRWFGLDTVGLKLTINLLEMELWTQDSDRGLEEVLLVRELYKVICYRIGKDDAMTDCNLKELTEAVDQLRKFMVLDDLVGAVERA